MWPENGEWYYRLVKQQAEQFEAGYSAYLEACLKGLSQCCKCDDLAAFAYLEYALYRYTGDKKYGRQAACALTDMGKLSDRFLREQAGGKRDKNASYTVRQAVLTSGRPMEAPMETMFCPTYFMLAYDGLKKDGFLDTEDMEYCKKAVLRSIKPLSEYTDWGPQNRGMIKGTNLVLAAVCFSEDERSSQWKKLGEILCGESLGKWSIEDASVYIPIWLNQVIMQGEYASI